MGTVVEERKVVVDNSKEQLVQTINQSVTDIINKTQTSGQTTDIAKITALHDELLKKVDSSLSTPTAITPTDVTNLKTEINKSIDDIQVVAGVSTTVAQAPDTSSQAITNTLNTLSQTVTSQTDVLKAQSVDLLYKDTNKDGISDYDSVYVYNISPTVPSPVSSYEGKTINAADKILLGFDPTKSEIVKVNVEQPVASTIAPVSTYKVKEVALTKNNAIVLTGQALPNSFITIYIYSTPIIVTVKTDSNGQWQYVLDKELESGDHTVYTATVNNSGNIVAKSSGFLFTKTAEAVSPTDLPITDASTNTQQPNLLGNSSLYIIIISVFVIIVMILILIGIASKRNKEK